MRLVAEVLAPPDVVAGIVTALNAALTPPVTSKVPNPRPAAFVTVTDLGGPGRAGVVVYRSTIGVEAWAKNQPDARDLCHLARAHLLALKGTTAGDLIFYDVIDVGAPGNLPDPLSNQDRYVATFEVAVRELKLA